jgi:diguanylate cyclase (GGDEF)-like protein/PAS domain S-box-containing protein
VITGREFKRRHLLLLSVCLLSFALIGGCFFTVFVTRYGANLEKERLVALAVTAAASCDANTVLMLKGNSSDVGTSAFELTRAELVRVRQSNPECRFVYLMAQRNNRIIFLVDSEAMESKDYSPPGEEYSEASPELHRIFADGQPFMEGPVTDRWGKWMTGLAPVYHPQTGQVIAVVGMDIRADKWLAIVSHYRWFGIVVAAQIFAMVTLFLLGLYLQLRYNEKVIKLNADLQRELTERERAEQGLRLAAAVIENTAEGIVVTRADGTIRKVNQSFEQITGWKAKNAIGQTMDILKSDQHDAAFFFDMERTLVETGKWKGEIWNRRQNGELYPQATTINALKESGGEIGHYAVIFSDVSEQKQLENKLRDLSELDGLTGLHNRRVFDETLLKEWKRAMRESSPLSVVMIDVDYFKKFNDAYGHLEGDACLQRLAHVLKSCVRRAADLAARYGGEEFAVILPETDQSGALGVANRIREELCALAIPHEKSEVATVVTASIGCATEVPQGDAIPSKLIERADRALYQAKTNGRNRVESL